MNKLVDAYLFVSIIGNQYRFLGIVLKTVQTLSATAQRGLSSDTVYQCIQNKSYQHRYTVVKNYKNPAHILSSSPLLIVKLRCKLVSNRSLDPKSFNRLLQKIEEETFFFK